MATKIIMANGTVFQVDNSANEIIDMMFPSGRLDQNYFIKISNAIHISPAHVAIIEEVQEEK